MKPLTSKGLILGLILLLCAAASTVLVYKVSSAQTNSPAAETE